jgi:hypothetical protein
MLQKQPAKMKKILILYPHFPPSNLAGVHRPRLFAQHLRSFGWEPVVVTVHEKYYEETPDWNLVKLLPPGLRIEKTEAFNLTRPRLAGDIGLRAFLQLYKRAKQLIKAEGFDFLYIPIPSFYCSLLGRLLHSSTGIPYGIDYIDPWVHDFPGSRQLFSRHWFSKKMAGILEPWAVKKAALITGVAKGYYQPMLDRNPALKKNIVSGAMPYGGEKADHALLKELHIQPYLFAATEKTQFVYAGAMMPKSYGPLEAIFNNVLKHPEHFASSEFHFIGTGKTANDPLGFNIKALAEKYGLWQTLVFEYPERIPYLDVLVHLNAADAVFILGSTEPHYTPSKTYQGVLSGKPIMALLHEQSSAAGVITDSLAGKVFCFNGEQEINKVSSSFHIFFEEFKVFLKDYDYDKVNMKLFEQYSAKNVTAALAVLLNQATK